MKDKGGDGTGCFGIEVRADAAKFKSDEIWQGRSQNIQFVGP